MYELIAGFPQQLERAIALGRTIVAPSPIHEIRNIVVAGMGGSGIGANIVENLVKAELTLPYQITKTYTVPASVTKHTLFVFWRYRRNPFSSCKSGRKRCDCIRYHFGRQVA